MSETPNTITAIKKELLMRLGHDADIFALISLCTREPYVVCDEETFDDEVFLFLDEEEVKKEAMELLEKMGLSDKADCYPCQLSGGQQQRVAIARALALHPQILFFDEPTSALDPELTGEILKVIRQLASEHMTMVIVTHEMAFARDVADRVIFMDGGYIIEQGDPKEVIEHPKEERTKQFLARFAQN